MAASFFRLQIVSLNAMIFDGDVKSVYLTGDEGEYELLPYHFPLMGALVESEIKIWGYDPIPIRAGVVLFRENRCTIIIEETEDTSASGNTSWSGLSVLGTDE